MAHGDATENQIQRFDFNQAVADARQRQLLGMKLVAGHPTEDKEDFPLVTEGDIADVKGNASS